QIAKLAPKDAESLKEYKRVVGTALRVMVNSEVPERANWDTKDDRPKIAGYTVLMGTVGRDKEKDAVPAFALKREKGNVRYVIWLHPSGKASLFEKGKVIPTVKSLTDAGFIVLAPDLLGTGENAFSKPFPVDKGF